MLMVARVIARVALAADHQASVCIVHLCSLLLISIVPACADCAIRHVPLMGWSEVSTLVTPVLRSLALNAAGEIITSDGRTTCKTACNSAGNGLPASPMI